MLGVLRKNWVDGRDEEKRRDLGNRWRDALVLGFYCWGLRQLGFQQDDP